jgi:Ni,Fe-hydrogenase I large subunit
VNQIYDHIIHEYTISLILKNNVKSFTVLDPTSTVEVMATLQALVNLRQEHRSDNKLLKDEIKTLSKSLTNKI